MSRPRVLLASTLVLGGLALGARCGPSEPTTWYVLAGQSNQVGASTQATPLVAVGVAWRKNGGVIHEQRGILDPLVFYDDPDVPGASSAWPRFAERFSGASGAIVGFVASARGNQCLATDVDHPNAGNWDPESGWLYAQTLEIWQAAGSPPLAGFLWLQGECEAGHWHRRMLAEDRDWDWQYQQSFLHYQAALENLADHVLVDFGVPVVAAPISLRLCRWENEGCDPALFKVATKSRGVHDATIAAAAAHPGILAGPLSDDLRMMPDLTHTWDVNGLGERWYAALAEEGLL
jgi:hypothetical protein